MLQARALQDTESLLLVDDDETRPLPAHLVLDQRVCADDDIDVAALEQCAHAPFLRLGARSDQHFGAHTQLHARGKQALGVLKRERLRGRHQGALKAVADGREQRRHGEHGLAGPDVALDEALHPAPGLQVDEDLVEHTPLRPRELEVQRLQIAFVQ